jgi:hypothetical protein
MGQKKIRGHANRIAKNANETYLSQETSNVLKTLDFEKFLF